MTKSLKTNYDVHHQVESFFTGSHIQFTSDGKHFYCACGSLVNKVSVEDGQVKAQIKSNNDDDIVIRFTLTPNSEVIIIAYHSGLIMKYNLVDETIEREFKSIHTAPIACLKINPSGTLLATGSSDGTIKLWNLNNHYCSHNLKGVNGLISCIEFFEYDDGEFLFCAGGDDSVHMFDLETSQRVTKLKTHCSTVTDIKIIDLGKRLLTFGRDKIAVLWDINRSESKTFGTTIRTVPIYESVESAVVLAPSMISDLVGVENEDSRVFFATIGEEGTIKFWDTKTGSKIAQQTELPLSKDRNPAYPCFQLVQRPDTNELCAVSAEQNLFFYELPSLKLTQQLQGHLDEIFSACWFAKNRYIALACNSNDLKVIEVETAKCRHLRGHSDTVLCVCAVPNEPMCLVTSSKDCSILVWRFDPETMDHTIVYKGTGHTHEIHALKALNGEPTFFSGGEDTTLKRWSFPVSKKTKKTDKGESHPVQDEVGRLVASQTIKAHKDRIDDISVSPNDQVIATASRDKTAMIFSAANLSILATLKGHKRGVYAVQFSPTDQVVVTAGDTTLRMWNLNDFTCIKTFQGHDCAVLNFSFLSSGLQIISVGSDGNMKLWDCKTSECIKTIDAHDSNTWALALTEDDDLIVTGGNDEKLVIWKDSTLAEQEERLENLQQQVTREQDFINYVNKKKWRKAFRMALEMENQSKTLSVMKEILLEPQGVTELSEILCKCNLNQLNFIIECCVGWSASAKNGSIAQQALNIIISQFDTDQLLKMPSLTNYLSQLKALTEKSFNRYEQLVQQAIFVDFFFGSFKIQ